MDITAFKGNFAHGARPNLYEVSIGSISDPKVRFLCKGTALPGSNIGEIELPYMGRIIKLAGDRTFENWDVTIFNDTDFGIRGEIEAWMMKINSHEGNVGSTTMADYMEDGSVMQLDRNGSPLYHYEFKDIWPSVLGPIEMAYDSNNTVEEYTVTFSVGTYWKSKNAQ